MARIDVDEHGARAQARDAADGREEGEGRGDDLVARPHAERHQRHQQRVGARGQPDRVPGAGERRHLALEPSTSGPRMKRCSSKTLAMAASSASRRGAFCALTSSRGTFTRGRRPSRRVARRCAARPRRPRRGPRWWPLGGPGSVLKISLTVSPLRRPRDRAAP